MTIRSQLSNAAAKSSAILVRTFCALPVVGVVVAGGERVGAEHDPALDLGAEALGAGALVHRHRGRRRRRRAGRSGRRRSGRGWPRPRPARSRSRPRSRARRAAARSRRARRRARSIAPSARSKTRGDARLDALGVVGEVAGDPDPQAREVLAVGQLDPALDPDRGRVVAVATLHQPEQQRGVGDVARQRPALVERGGEGDHPVARDRAVGRLQADDPAQRRGLADRAAGVGADRPGREPAGDRGRRAARGAARARGRGPRG